MWPLDSQNTNSVCDLTPFKSITPSQSSSLLATTPPATPSLSSNEGLTLENKIRLGVGIGFGVPTLLMGIWGLVVAIKAAKGHYNRLNSVASWSDPRKPSYHRLDKLKSGELPPDRNCGLHPRMLYRSLFLARVVRIVFPTSFRGCLHSLLSLSNYDYICAI